MVKITKSKITHPKKVRIAFFDIQEWEKKHIINRFHGFKVKLFSEQLNEKTVELAKNFDVISIFIYSKIDKALLSKLPNLKMIATRSTGFDHIDTLECNKKKIVVCNVPRYGDTTVAEHAFALILSLARKIHKSYERTIRADFSNDGLCGFDLRGKTLGVIGTGNIGKNVIRIAKGFEFNILAYDAFPNKNLATEMNFKYVTLNYLLKNSDIITLHTPYLPSTYHLINTASISKMKKGAFLINTARGALVDTKSLMKALINKKLGGAGLDAIEEEDVIKKEEQILIDKMSNEKIKTLLEDHILLKLDNVIITPHNAYNSKEALQRILNTTIDNIQSFNKGNTINQVKIK